MKHLEEVNLTYFQHLKWAFNSSCKLLYAGLTCMVHSVMPFLFQDVAKNIVYNIYDELEERRIKAKDKVEPW